MCRELAVAGVVDLLVDVAPVQPIKQAVAKSRSIAKKAAR
jgi:hypothetical protein